MTTATKTEYRAGFNRKMKVVRTRWHATPEAAQDALMRRAGHFVRLGGVSGDVFEGGRCTWAPRNGGAVFVESR